MALKPGSSQKTISSNVKELADTKPSAGRAKGIKTIARKEGISPEKAKVKQAVAIAESKADRSKKRGTSDGYMNR